MNRGFGKDFYRKGNSVKRFTEPPDSENLKVTVLIPFPKISAYNLEDRNLLKLRSLDSSCPFSLSDNSIWG